MAGHHCTPGDPTLALCGGTVVVSLDPPEVVSCDVLVEGSRVAGLASAPPGVARRDCTGTLVVPGNVCAHHHLYSALARGMPYGLAAPRSFTQILQRVWWRLDRALDEPSVRASAMRGGLEALLCGTTTIVDHHASPNFIDGSLDVMAEALAELGVRSVLCYEVTERDGSARAVAGLEENRRFLKRQGPLVRGMVGAHASFTVSDETLASCVETAISAGVGVHIHVAEDQADQRDCAERFGRRVVERLSALGVVNERSLLAHCVHVDDLEISMVEGSGATVVCNPRSNMNNSVGHSPFNHRGGKVALGTDGIGGDMLFESQAGFFRAKESDVLTSPSWPLTHLAEGARFAGTVFGEPLLGTLRPGAPADICVIDYDPPAPLHAENLAGHWVFGLSAGHVRDVYVAGEQVVAGGRSTRVDEQTMAAEELRTSEQLWQRLERIPAHEYEPTGGDIR